MIDKDKKIRKYLIKIDLKGTALIRLTSAPFSMRYFAIFSDPLIHAK